MAIEKGFNWNIEVNELENTLRDIIKKGYGETIQLKINGELYTLTENGKPIK
jgi:hypothetical protein